MESNKLVALFSLVGMVLSIIGVALIDPSYPFTYGGGIALIVAFFVGAVTAFRYSVFVAALWNYGVGIIAFGSTSAAIQFTIGDADFFSIGVAADQTTANVDTDIVAGYFLLWAGFVVALVPAGVVLLKDRLGKVAEGTGKLVALVAVGALFIAAILFWNVYDEAPDAAKFNNVGFLTGGDKALVFLLLAFVAINLEFPPLFTVVAYIGGEFATGALVPAFIDSNDDKIRAAGALAWIGIQLIILAAVWQSEGVAPGEMAGKVTTLPALGSLVGFVLAIVGAIVTSSADSYDTSNDAANWSLASQVIGVFMFVLAALQENGRRTTLYAYGLGYLFTHSGANIASAAIGDTAGADSEIIAGSVLLAVGFWVAALSFVKTDKLGPDSDPESRPPYVAVALLVLGAILFWAWDSDTGSQARRITAISGGLGVFYIALVALVALVWFVDEASVALIVYLAASNQVGVLDLALVTSDDDVAPGFFGTTDTDLITAATSITWAGLILTFFASRRAWSKFSESTETSA